MIKPREKPYQPYRRTLERGLVCALLFLLIFFHILPKRYFSPSAELAPITFRFTVEEMPMTRQAARLQARPEHPAVPIESLDPDLPQDAVIDAADFTAGTVAGTGVFRTAAKQDTIPPRPMVQVLPEYTRELQKMNVRGEVRLMLWVNVKGFVEYAVVSENNTGNEVCETAAVDAAKMSSYWPATIDKKPVAMWVSCTYSFRPN